MDDDRDMRDISRDPAHDSCLGGMGMEKVVPVLAHQTDKSNERECIAERSDRPDEFVNQYDANASRQRFGFTGTRRIIAPAPDNIHRITAVAKPDGGKKRILSRSAQVKPGDDVTDFHCR